MFEQTVWDIKRFIDIKQALRELHIPARRADDDLGLCGPDFSDMAQSRNGF